MTEPKWTTGRLRVDFLINPYAWSASKEGNPPRIIGEFLVVGNDPAEAEANAHLFAAADDLYQACQFIKNYLNSLEKGTAEDDPLHAIRKTFHAPLHETLDSAMSKARGEK